MWSARNATLNTVVVVVFVVVVVVVFVVVVVAVVDVVVVVLALNLRRRSPWSHNCAGTLGGAEKT